MFYKKDNYLDKSIEYIISSDIIEYDMKQAGLSVTKKHKLLDEDIIESLENMTKSQRNIKMGLIKRTNKQFAEKEIYYIREYRRQFMEANNLKEEDILSIKKDAIYTKRRCEIVDFDGIRFVEKNVYTSYYYLNKKEIYVGKNNIDIKGISDEIIDMYHRDNFCKELWRIFKIIETSPKETIIKRLVHMANTYKELKYPIEYYRDMDSRSLYRLKRGVLKSSKKGVTVFATDVGDKEILDISYNYIKYITPLINLFL